MSSKSNSDLKKFVGKYPAKEFKKGEIIIFQGEAPSSAYVVIEGIVKAYNISVEGDEKPVAFYGSDSIFPGPWVYGKIEYSTFYYEAFTSLVKIAAVPRSAFIEFIKSYPEQMYAELERHVFDKLGLAMRLNALEYSKASDKLLYTLHYLATIYGRNSGSHSIEIVLTLTHQDFANLTGLTRETAATELNKLKHSGIIDYDKHKPYRVDMIALNSLLHDQYITDMDKSI